MRRLAADLRPALDAFESVRERHTLLAKRLNGGDAGLDSARDARLDHLASRVRRTLAGTPPIRARVDGIDRFDDPPRGAAPVVYLEVESPGLRSVHRALVEELGAVEGLEGDGYVPHVTLARGGDPEAARRLCAREVEPVEWTIEGFELYDATHEVVARRIALPA